MILDFHEIKSSIVPISTFPVPSPAPPDPEESFWHPIQVPTLPTALEASVEQYGLVKSDVQELTVHYNKMKWT